MIYYCDFTKNAQKDMEKHGVNNDDVQEIFNHGLTESPRSKTLEKDGYKLGVFYYYDGYTLRHVVVSIFKRPLKMKRGNKGER